MELTCETIWSCTSVCWEFCNHSFNFNACDWPFIFSVSSGSVLGACTLLRVHPFLLGCPYYWHIVTHSSLLWPFVFLWCPLQLLLFHFWFYWFYWALLLFFFLMSLAKGLPIFSFQRETKRNLVSLIFSIVTLNFFLVYILLLSTQSLLVASFH